MKLDKNYYVIVCTIVFVCGLISSIFNVSFITGFIIILIPTTIFNIIWNMYHNAKGE